MKWSYDLCGAEPIIKDMPVYDAATLAYGELLMLSAGAFSAGAGGNCLLTAVPDTVGSTMAVDACGVCLQDLDTDNANASGFISDNPSVATAINTTVAQPVCMAKVIINPFAVYRAAVSTADALAVASSANTSEVCVTGIAADTSDGCWVAFTASAGPNYGSVTRVISSGTGGTLDLTQVQTATITTADEVCVFSPKLTNPSILNAAATMIASSSVGGYTATNLRVVENYINGEIMKESVHDRPGYKNKDGMKHIESEIMMKDHMFGVQE